MSSKTSELLVSSWIATGEARPVQLRAFYFSEDAYEPLAQWCQERNPGRNVYRKVVLAGLSEILAFFVPEIAYFDSGARHPGTRHYTLALYVVDEDCAREDLPQKVSLAINIWLGRIYAKKSPEVRNLIAASALDMANWRTDTVSPIMKNHEGICACPEDDRYFNALAAQTVRQLAGRKITFASGETKTLVRRVPQASPYGGIELVAFPPKQQIGGAGFYTEVVNISVKTFPERKEGGLNILVHPHMRNWASIRSYDRVFDKSRSLDIFLPPHDGDAVIARYHHTSFPFRALGNNWKDVIDNDAELQIVPRWASDHTQPLFDLIRSLVGSDTIKHADLMKPLCGDAGLWVLPRQATGSGDRYLAGGTGVGWPDRLDIAKSLDTPLRDLGFRRAEPLKRISGVQPVSGPFRGDPAGARKALMKTLNQIGNDDTLDVVVFHIQDETPEQVKTAISKTFGDPDETDGAILSWSDGLNIRLLSKAAGPFAVALPKVALTDAEGEGRTKDQQKKMLAYRRKEATKGVTDQMSAYLSNLRGEGRTIGCAIVEMSSALRGRDNDPFRAARTTLAKHDILPQVVLVDEDASTEKYRASFADCLRMLGVVPIYDKSLQPAPAAITIASRDAAQNQSAKALPLAARVVDGVLEGAMPDMSGTPQWQPYAHLALALYRGDFESTSRNRDPQNLARVQTFVGEALDHINAKGQALVMLDGNTLRTFLPGLSNKSLSCDRLDIGLQVLRPKDLPNSRLVRINTLSDELPSYHHENTTQWPTGAFSWGGERTAYCLKAKPGTLKTLGPTSNLSRNLAAGDNTAADNKARRAAAMDEVCVFLAQPDDNLKGVLLKAHRLRSEHVQYGDHTKKPFPLHELGKLAGALQ